MSTVGQHFVVLLPYWPSKLYFHLYVRKAVWHKVFYLRCRAVACPTDKLHDKKLFILLKIVTWFTVPITSKDDKPASNDFIAFVKRALATKRPEVSAS